jgi:hypothetical protein
MNRIAIAIVLVALLTTSAWSQYQVGDPVDDFTLLNSQGQPVSLSDYPEQIVFLSFWETG